MHKLDRQKKILALLHQQEVVTVEEICTRLASSAATVRRDLNDLDASNQLLRVHGGATGLPRKLGGADFETNLSKHKPEKTEIARHAASLCHPGDSIILNGGTTTWHMCEFLRGKPLQLLTNSLPVATTLQSSACQVFLTGGEVYADQHIVLGDYLSGDTGSASARQFFASRIFMGSHAITRHGLMESDTRLIQAERMLIDQAEELILLADSSKFTGRGLLQLCPLERVSMLITDSGISEPTYDLMSRARVKVIVVEAMQEVLLE
jgi:DeoR/GlpR family transcriptional regulator of sugar metabolism